MHLCVREQWAAEKNAAPSGTSLPARATRCLTTRPYLLQLDKRALDCIEPAPGRV